MAQSYRMRFTFWLDVVKDGEMELAEQLQAEKKRRGFTAAIRDGLRLLFDLRRGSTAVLFDLFPHLEADLKRGAGGDGSSEIKALRDEIRHLRSMLETGSMVHKTSSAATLSPSGDDLLGEMVITEARRDEDNLSNYNLMISSALLVLKSADSLPDEVLTYGLRTGRILPEQIGAKRRAKLDATPTKKPVKAGTGNAKKMDVPQIAAPSFDDLELELTS